MKVAVSAIVMVGALTGCATSTYNYNPPTDVKIGNTKHVAAPFDAVWDKLVRELSSDFFVINNIDKSSRLINLSFSTQQPSTYVDCGITTRTFTNARGTQNYSYPTSDSAQYMVANNQGHMFRVMRHSKLDGRSNVYVAPEDGGTIVTVNTKYVVEGRQDVTNISGQNAGSIPHTFDFSTKQSFTSPEGVTCFSRGVIEQKILDFVGR